MAFITDFLNRVGFIKDDWREVMGARAQGAQAGSLRTYDRLMDNLSIKGRIHWEYAEYAEDLKDPAMYLRYLEGKLRPVRTNAWDGNLLTTVGAGDLWNGLVTAGLGTPFNSTNAQCAVGDSSTAATNAQTDMQAAAGSAIQTSGFTSVTNATPQVITNGSGNWSTTPAVGQVVTISGITTDTQINNTWEVQASSATTVTALNSTAGGVAGSLASGVMKIINYYRQTVNGAPSTSTNQVQFVSVFGANNANFHAQEWGIATGGGGTNKVAQPPPHLLDRVVQDNGTKAQGNTATLTATLSLS